MINNKAIKLLIDWVLTTCFAIKSQFSTSNVEDQEVENSGWQQKVKQTSNRKSKIQVVSGSSDMTIKLTHIQCV